MCCFYALEGKSYKICVNYVRFNFSMFLFLFCEYLFGIICTSNRWPAAFFLQRVISRESLPPFFSRFFRLVFFYRWSSFIRLLFFVLSQYVHAANVLGLETLLWLYIRRKKKNEVKENSFASGNECEVQRLSYAYIDSWRLSITSRRQQKTRTINVASI